MIEESSTHLCLEHFRMPSDPLVKTWQPARFTIGTLDQPTNPSTESTYAVLILNQPLEQRDLLIDVCSKGMWLPLQLNGR